MADKELRRMGRGDLIEIIYQYQCREKELEEENERLRCQLNDRDIRIQKAGSIADAVLSLNHVFEVAQAAANQYLEILQQRCEQVQPDIDGKKQISGDTVAENFTEKA